jgi:hypothetical protein
MPWQWIEQPMGPGSQRPPTLHLLSAQLGVCINNVGAGQYHGGQQVTTWLFKWFLYLTACP